MGKNYSNNNILFITGSSCSGKNYLIEEKSDMLREVAKEIFEDLLGDETVNLNYIQFYTSRDRREDERHLSSKYFNVERKVFEKLKEEDTLTQLLEKEDGNFYFSKDSDLTDDLNVVNIVITTPDVFDKFVQGDRIKYSFFLSDDRQKRCREREGYVERPSLDRNILCGLIKSSKLNEVNFIVNNTGSPLRVADIDDTGVREIIVGELDILEELDERCRNLASRFQNILNNDTLQ